jgi:hypothetical protein
MARYGSMSAALGWALLNLTMVCVSPLTKSAITRGQYVGAIIGFGVLGQLLTWAGMIGLRQCDGWRCGILPYIWSGALLTSIVVGGTLLSAAPDQAYLGALIPWIAPVVGTVARGRVGE